jgi:hypothetical protein
MDAMGLPLCESSRIMVRAIRVLYMFFFRTMRLIMVSSTTICKLGIVVLNEYNMLMPRSSMGHPHGFARRFSTVIRQEVLSRGGELAGRWLAARTSFSKTYAYERLNYIKPFNMNDVQELADLFEIDVDDLVSRAFKTHS